MDRSDGGLPPLDSSPLQVGGEDRASPELRIEFAEHEAWLVEALDSLAPDERAAVLSQVVDDDGSESRTQRDKSSEAR